MKPKSLIELFLDKGLPFCAKKIKEDIGYNKHDNAETFPINSVVCITVIYPNDNLMEECVGYNFYDEISESVHHSNSKQWILQDIINN